MKVYNITPARQKAWDDIQEYLKKNPEATANQAMKAMEVTPSTWHMAKKALGGKSRKKYTRQPKMITIVPESHKSSIVAFVGDADSVVQSVQKFMRGDA